MIFFLVTWTLLHADADWIQRGGYKNAGGELCCGVTDCTEVKGVMYSVMPSGYVLSNGDFVPESEALPSPGGYWLCQSKGRRKCFFAPLRAT